MRLPDTLGQPSSEGTLSENCVHAVGKRPNLADAIPSRDAHKNRLVIPAREQLDLPAPHEIGEVSDDVGAVRLEPVQKGSGEMEARFHLGMAVQRGDQRGIRPLGHILEN